MTFRHNIVILGVSCLTVCGVVAPSPSYARAPGIADAAPANSLRTAARLTETPAQTPPTPGWSEAEQRIVELVNDERAARGLAALVVLPELVNAADAHALDQRNRPCGSLTHTGTDGSNVADRVDRTGLTWTRLAENIACGYPDAATVMSKWMQSSGHRRNILHPDLTQIGVSLERSNSGATYWVQVFAAVPS